MKLKSIKEVKNLRNKRVLLRVGMDVAIDEAGRIAPSDDYRLRRSLPTINYLLEKKAKVILLTKLGRPGGKIVETLRVNPIAARLSVLLGRQVKKLDDCIGDEVEKYIANMSSGEVVLLENVRFYPEEKANSSSFAKKLASLADIYVNDAFTEAHRRTASLVAITKCLPSYAGLLLMEEIKELDRILSRPKRPIVAIMGGAKIETKIKVINKLAPQVDYLLVGGGLGCHFLKAKGYKVGRSLFVKELLSYAARLLKRYNKKIILPLDVTVDDTRTESLETWQKNIEEIKRYDKVIDIGTRTVLAWSDIIKQSKTIFWNGPLGIIEDKKSSHSTRALAELLAARSRRHVFTLVGGGETITLLYQMGIADDFDYLSTGGGSLLEYLQGVTLPALRPLLKK